MHVLANVATRASRSLALEVLRSVVNSGFISSIAADCVYIIYKRLKVLGRISLQSFLLSYCFDCWKA